MRVVSRASYHLSFVAVITANENASDGRIKTFDFSRHCERRHNVTEAASADEEDGERLWHVSMLNETTK